MLCQAALDQEVGIHAIAVQFEASIIENKVDPASCLLAQFFDSIPKLREVIAEDIFFCCSKVVSACRLEGFDLLLGHVYKEGQIGGVAPKAHL